MRDPSSTTAAAVSSQDDSMPRIRTILQSILGDNRDSALCPRRKLIVRTEDTGRGQSALSRLSRSRWAFFTAGTIHVTARQRRLSATFAIPALAHAASLSPPGAPLTATAPMVISPNLIGTPPCALMVPAIVAGGAATPGGGGCAGPDGRS